MATKVAKHYWYWSQVGMFEYSMECSRTFVSGVAFLLDASAPCSITLGSHWAGQGERICSASLLGSCRIDTSYPLGGWSTSQVTIVSCSFKVPATPAGSLTCPLVAALRCHWWGEGHDQEATPCTTHRSAMRTWTWHPNCCALGDQNLNARIEKNSYFMLMLQV